MSEDKNVLIIRDHYPPFGGREILIDADSSSKALERYEELAKEVGLYDEVMTIETGDVISLEYEEEIKEILRKMREEGYTIKLELHSHLKEQEAYLLDVFTNEYIDVIEVRMPVNATEEDIDEALEIVLDAKERNYNTVMIRFPAYLSEKVKKRWEEIKNG